MKKSIKGLLGERRRDERGATLILVAICMVLLLWGGAFGVDLGLSVVGSRQTQAIADTSALDMARYMTIVTNPSSYSTQLAATNYLNTKLPDAVTDNGSSATLSYTPGVWLNGSFSAFGTAEGDKGCYYYTPPAGHPCNAVEVTATSSVPQIFLGDNKSVSRTAIAAVTPVAGFSIGSFLASFNAQQTTVLNAILSPLGATANVTAVGFEGLANTYVSIRQLVTASGGLLTTSNVMTTSLTGAQWLAIWNDAVANQVASLNCGATPEPLPCEASTGLSALDFNPSTSAQLCNLVSINGSTCASGTTLSTPALASNLDVLQTLTTEAEVANNNSPLDLGTSLGITGVTDAKLTLDLTQIPQMAYGPVTTTAQTAQVSSDLQLDDPGLGGVFNIPLSATDGTATLNTITCTSNSLFKAAITPAITAPSGSVTLAGTGIATLTVAGYSGSSLNFSGANVPPTASTVSGGNNPVANTATTPIYSWSGLSTSSPYYTFLTSTLAGVLVPVLQAAGVTVSSTEVADLSTNCDPVSLVQ